MSDALLLDVPDDTEATEPEETISVRDQLVAAILQGGLKRARVRHSPAATYRLQFNAGFRFADATRIAPYLEALGITHVYASPYLAAPAGSEHGYDVTNPQAFNTEVGSPEEFATWVQALREHGLGHILDFVPNHMGVATDANPWWQDVLENGQSSAYAAFFDIDWSPLKPDLVNKVLLPVLGEQFGRVLENCELQLEYEQGAFHLRYFARRFPLTPRSYARILDRRVEELVTQLGAESERAHEYQSILTAVRNLPPHDATEPAQRQERDREKEVIKRRLQRLGEEEPACLTHIQQNLELLNGTRGEPRSFDALEELLREQPYRLAYWRVASEEINYRRFFDVNELAAVCMEQPEVFAKAHSLVLRLIDEGQLDGLRIDHADGLYDPTGYLRQLQTERIVQLCRAEHSALGEDATQVPWLDIEPEIRQAIAAEPSAADLQPLYVVAEKILERNERLPTDWAVAGTTGYDFVNDVNGLFVASENERALDALYRRFVARNDSFEELAYHGKRLIMKVAMSSETNVLGHQLDRISEGNRLSCDFTLHGLTHALREIAACFPVYRTYIASDTVLERDRVYIEQAVARAKRRNPATNHAVFDYIKELLLMQGLEQASEPMRELRRKFVRRFQQFTGPVMAKSVEDTVYYRYHRLISLNEVGGDPKRFGLSVAAFHQQNQQRQAFSPFALLATSTHDTKRSEDTRARIDVLSEIPTEWKERVLRWARWNKRKKTKIDGELAPSRNDEYLLYQTLVGVWPIGEPVGPEFCERICQYMVKAIREAKAHSSWITPHEAYERAVREFVEAILCPEPASAFRSDFEPLVQQLARAGWWNSLAQTLLKVTSPGVPDVYPGTEGWHLRLVDPDNRQPVDFDQLQQQLATIQAEAAGLSADRRQWLKQLVESAADGRIKQFVLSEALRLRRANPDLFTLGAYLPLEVEGPHASHVVAFARSHEDQAAVIVVPRLATTLTQQTGPAPCGAELWAGTRVHLPSQLANREWRQLYSGLQVAPGEWLDMSALLADFPVALLVAE